MKINPSLFKLFHLGLKIEKNFFNKTRFKDGALEKNFQKSLNIVRSHKDLLCDLFSNLVYLAFLAYVSIDLFWMVPFLICTSFSFFLILLPVLNFYSKNIRIKFYLNHLSIFSTSLVNLAIIIASNIYNQTSQQELLSITSNNFHYNLIRSIIYNSLFINIKLATKLEEDFKISTFYFLVNLIIFCISKFYYSMKSFYFVEIFMSLFTFLIFYIMRREYDLIQRLYFLQKQKLEFFNDYALEYINGLNGYVLNLRNNSSLFFNNKVIDLVNKILIPNKKEEIKLALDNKKVLSKYESKRFDNYEIKSYQKSENSVAQIFKNLIFFENYENDISINYFIDHIKSIRNHANVNFQENDKNILLNGNQTLSNNNIFKNQMNKETTGQVRIETKRTLANNDRKTDISISLIDILETLDKEFKGRKTKIGENKINHNKAYSSKLYYSNSKKYNLNDLIKKKNKKKNQSQNLYFSESFQYENNSKYLSKNNSKVNDVKRFDSRIQLSKSSSNLIERKLSEDLSLKSINNSESNENFKGHFKSIGIFYFKDKDSDDTNNMNSNHALSNINKSHLHYYNIYHRRIYYDNYEYIDNLYLVDVSDLINQKQNIINENIKQQKLFAKLAHEFKTPLNTVMGLISNIKDREKIISNQTKSQLDIIDNLSNYLVFLISDMINYVNINQLSDIKINIAKFELQEILHFCFQILETLVSCNNNKKRNIKCELKINENLKKVEVELDEIRVKQILLNLISNAVKFTNDGSIIIKCKTMNKNGNNKLKITVKDTGIGIEENNQKDLFEDFKMFDNNNNRKNNKYGSGLGLSICKYLCEKMKVQLSYKSEYFKGSKFNLEISENNWFINSNITSKKIVSCKSSTNNLLIIKEKQENKKLRSNDNLINLNWIAKQEILNSPRSLIKNSIVGYKNYKNAFTFNRNDINNYVNTRTNNSGNNKRRHALKTNKTSFFFNKQYFNNLSENQNPNYDKSGSLDQLEKKNEEQNLGHLHCSTFYKNTKVINKKLLTERPKVRTIESMNTKETDIYRGDIIFSAKSTEIRNIAFSNDESSYLPEERIYLYEINKPLRLAMSKTHRSKVNKPIIMIVDDNEIINSTNKRIINEILLDNDLDYKIVSGNDGYDIIRKVLNYEKKNNLIKCVFTDENMDYLIGSEAISFIRKWEKVKKLSPINFSVLTCHEDVNIINSIYSAGADNILTKPITKSSIKLIFKKIGLIE